MTALPKQHARGEDGRPLCKAQSRRWGTLFAAYPHQTDCKACLKLVQASERNSIEASVPKQASERNSIEASVPEISEVHHGVMTEETFQKVTEIVRLLKEAVGEGHPFAVIIGQHVRQTTPGYDVSVASNLNDTRLVALLQQTIPTVMGARKEKFRE